MIAECLRTDCNDTGRLKKKQLLADTHAHLAHPRTPTTHSVFVFVLPGLLFRAHHSNLPHSVSLWQISAFRCAAFRDFSANSAYSYSDALAGSGLKGT